MCERCEKTSSGEIEITEAMITAGAAALLRDPYLDDLGEGYAEDLALRVLRSVLKPLVGQNSEAH